LWDSAPSPHRAPQALEMAKLPCKVLFVYAQQDLVFLVPLLGILPRVQLMITIECYRSVGSALEGIISMHDSGSSMRMMDLKTQQNLGFGLSCQRMGHFWRTGAIYNTKGVVLKLKFWFKACDFE
jgi:hypothetical protein